jgi:hypothetical protein
MRTQILYVIILLYCIEKSTKKIREIGFASYTDMVKTNISEASAS